MLPLLWLFWLQPASGTYRKTMAASSERKYEKEFIGVIGGFLLIFLSFQACMWFIL
jgi:hypothetical protein